jgi:hypothetical protein
VGFVADEVAQKQDFLRFSHAKLSFHQFSILIYHQGLTDALDVLAKPDVARRYYSTNYPATHTVVLAAEFLQHCV